MPAQPDRHPRDQIRLLHLQQPADQRNQVAAWTLIDCIARSPSSSSHRLRPRFTANFSAVNLVKLAPLGVFKFAPCLNSRVRGDRFLSLGLGSARQQQQLQLR